jgi:murein DD-endopeptidase MepM/ murein hydrolase activator NlpD
LGVRGSWTIAASFTAAATMLAAAIPAGPVAAQDTPALEMATAARSFQPGELIVVTLSMDGEASAVRVRVFDRVVPAFRTAARDWQALVGIDLDRAPGAYTLAAEARLATGMVRRTLKFDVHAKRFPTRTLKVAPGFVNPPPDQLARIDKDTVFLREAYAKPAPDRLWDRPFVRPVPGAANSQFGSRSVFNGEPRSPHSGADFLSPSGTPVRAPNAGRVVGARDLFFSGNTVIVDHGLGLFSTLAHLSRIDVREGQAVSAGEVVGLVGATGRVTGAHLHWALRVAGARVDPLALLELLGEETGPR